MHNPARIPPLIAGHLDNSYFGSMVAAPNGKEARPTHAAAQMGRGEARNLTNQNGRGFALPVESTFQIGSWKPVTCVKGLPLAGSGGLTTKPGCGDLTTPMLTGPEL